MPAAVFEHTRALFRHGASLARTSGRREKAIASCLGRRQRSGLMHRRLSVHDRHRPALGVRLREIVAART
jgi:hypothetical protein